EVLLKGNALVKAGRIVVDPQKDRRLYKVERTSGRWVWVASDTMSGWVKADDIIPFATAADYYTDEIRKDPKAAWAYNMRGLIRSDKGEVDKAIDDFSKAIQADPRGASFYNNRGNTWLAKKAYDKAIADFDESIGLAPRNAMAYNNRGNAWSGKKAYDKAIADYGEAVRSAPRHPVAYNNRA